jgi:hypothetical protein
MGGGLLQKVDALRVGAPVVDTGADTESLRRHTGVGDVHATAADVIAVAAEAKARLREEERGQVPANRLWEIEEVVGQPGTGIYDSKEALSGSRRADGQFWSLETLADAVVN